MIKCIKFGDYQLVKSKKGTKMLILDNYAYAWVNAKNIGELLIVSNKEHSIDSVLAVGKYRLYDVKDEPHLVDQLHLELLVGKGKWQGYLLLTGLPTDKDKRKRIIPTKECITHWHAHTLSS